MIKLQRVSELKIKLVFPPFISHCFTLTVYSIYQATDKAKNKNKMTISPLTEVSAFLATKLIKVFAIFDK
jgi:hypothetical protein